MTYPLRLVNHSIAACRTRLYRRVKPTRDAPFDGCQAPIGLKPRVSQHFETNQQATARGRVFRIDVRVTRREFQRIKSRTRKTGVGMSAYMRSHALNDPKDVPTIDVNADELKAAYANLKRAARTSTNALAS